METLDFIIVGVMVTAFLMIAIIVLRKWNVVRTIDVTQMPDMQLRAKKYALIEQRLQRKMQYRSQSVTQVFRAVFELIAGIFKTLLDRLVQLENKYRLAALSNQSEEGKEKTRQKVSGLLDEGIRLFKDGNIVEAENRFVDVIRLQPQEKDAYSFLAQIYMQKKEYDSAIETLKYVRKISSDDEQVHYTLGTAYEASEDMEKAVESYEKAVDIAPKNPRNLDALLKAAIAVEDRFLARDALRKLKEADPQNGKIAELEKKIDEL